MASKAELMLLLRAQDMISKEVQAAGRSIESLDKTVTSMGSKFAGAGSAVAGFGQSVTGSLGGFLKLSGAFAAGQLAANAFMGTINAIGGAFGNPIQGASDLNEAMNKVEVVFGANSEAVKQFASGSAQSLGLAKSAVLEATGTFGNLFKSVGLGSDAVLTMSEGVVQLAADLASFNNVDPAEALEKLRAGLVGEAEPLRTLGVNLNEAAVAQEALRLGLAKSKDEISEAAKMQARYSLILLQTKDAQGDFARTSDGMANAQRIITASFKDIGDAIGTRLLPLVAPLVSQFSRVLPSALDTLNGALDELQPAFDGVQASFSRALDAFKSGGLGAAVGSLLSDLNSFATGFFGAGLTMVESLAAGLMQGATSVVSQAAEFVASVIASFLVGQSPPPSGPLSQIDADGRRLIETYVSGFGTADLSPVDQVAERIQSVLGNKEGLEAQASAVAATVDQIGDAMRRLQDESFAEKDAVRQIHDQYDPIVDSIREQLDAIKDVNDLLGKQQDIQRELRGLTLDAAEEKAKGDPGRRAQLAGALEQNRFSQDQLRNEIALLSLNDKKGSNDKRIAALRAQMIGLDRQELQLKQQQAALTDRNAIAEVARQRALLQSEQTTARIKQRQEELNRAMQAAPLEQKLKDAEKAATDAIKPHEATLKVLQQESELLGMQQRQYQDLGKTIATSLSEIEKATAKQNAADKADKAGAGAGAAPTNVGLASGLAEQIKSAGAGVSEAAKQAGTDAGIKFAAGITAAIDQAKPGLLGGAIGGVLGAAAFGPLGAIAGAAFGSQLATGIQAKVPDIGAKLQSIQAVISSVFSKLGTGDFAGAFAEILPVLKNVGAQIGKQLQGWGEQFLTWIQPQIPGMLAQLGEMAVAIDKWVIEHEAEIAKQLLTWGKAFLEWVEPQIPGLLTQLGGLLQQILNWIGQQLPVLGAKLLEWGRALIAWVAPQIPAMITELLKLSTAVLKWAQGVLPPLAKQVGEWAKAFIGWVAPMIPGLLLELGKILVEIGGWVLGTGIPRLIVLALSMGREFIKGFLSGLDGLAAQLTNALINVIRGIRVDIGPFHLSSDGFTVDAPAPLQPSPNTPRQPAPTNSPYPDERTPPPSYTTGSTGSTYPSGLFPIPMFPGGGIMPGTGSRHRLAWVQPGEAVLNRMQQQAVLGGGVGAGGGPVNINIDMSGATISNEIDKRELLSDMAQKIAQLFASANISTRPGAPSTLIGA